MYNNQLIKNILKASNEIHKKSLSGSADYIITSTSASSYLSSIFLNENRKNKIKKLEKLWMEKI